MQSKIKQNHNQAGFYTILVVIIFTAIIFMAGIFVWQEQRLADKTDKILDQAANLSQNSSDDSNGDWQTYNSPTLGISFRYLSEGVDGAAVKEVGDKIFIYPIGSVPEHGQYVQVFSKDADSSLAEAVSQKFLMGYDTKDCFVKNVSDAHQLPKHWQTAIIGFPPTDNGVDPWWQNGDKCPQPYTETNGISFFVADQNHPEKFLFFSIGQYIIFGDSKENSWYDTLSIIDQTNN